MSLSEDPDLAVLEDDAFDIYYETVAASAAAASSARESETSSSSAVFGSGTGGLSGFVNRGRDRVTQHHRGPAPSSRFKPLSSVHYSSSPLPCFSGDGILRDVASPSPRPPGQLRASVARHGNDKRNNGSPPAFSTVDLAAALGGRLSTAPPPDPQTNIGDVGDGGIGLGHNEGLRQGLDLRGSQNFDALMGAFGRRGRADRGVGRWTGTGIEVGVIDDMHARLTGPGRRLDGAGGRREGGGGVTIRRKREGGGRVPVGVEELGVCTSTAPKEGRWVIGRRMVGGASVNGVANGTVVADDVVHGGCGVVDDSAVVDGGGGEFYVTIEAPVFAVGDARAAADRLASSVVGGSGGVGAMSDGRDDAVSVGGGGNESESVVKWRSRRRRYLR